MSTQATPGSGCEKEPSAQTGRIKASKPFQGEHSLYRLEVTKMPSQMQSVALKFLTDADQKMTLLERPSDGISQQLSGELT